MRFRLTFWPTVFTIPAVIAMLALGIWQIQRLSWKTAIIAERAAAVAATPAPLPVDIAATAEFRRVSATGTFLNDRELFLGALSKNGNEGFQIVTPMRLGDGSILMVNRGWVPRDRKLAATRAEGQLAATVTIDGLVRSGAVPQGLFRPDNDPAKNFWFYVDIPAMAKATALAGERLRDFYIDAGPAPVRGGFPIGGQTNLELPNDHLQYAVTWFLLAAALVVVYVVYHHQKAAEAARGLGPAGSVRPEILQP